MIRTRRLFTTLNKKAKPVNKAAIISLDEDDLAASLTRSLVEDSETFSEEKIKFQPNNNVSYSDVGVITTIGNLYDLVRIILKEGFGLNSKVIDNFRGKTEEREKYYSEVDCLFEYMFSSIPELSEFSRSNYRSDITSEYRRRIDGGHFLFRPLGLKIFIISLCKYSGIRKKDGISFDEAAVEFIDSSDEFELYLESDLLEGRVWDKNNKRILALKAEDRNFIVNSYVETAVNLNCY